MVHSVKSRLKEPEHVKEKIIRKKIKNSELDINMQNYKEIVTDLVGVRALHLFKEDWGAIHDYIINKWELKEPPTANVRKGDNEKQFIDKYCSINYHEYGYRSVHYLVEAGIGKDLDLVEIQVRTIFEEGWSEIDHKIRYPYDKDNPILAPFLFHFNTLAGNADEMGSYIKFLQEELNRREAEVRKLLDERDEQIIELQKAIGDLKIDKEDKEKLRSGIENINQRNNYLAKILPTGLTDAVIAASKINIPPGLIDAAIAASKINVSVKGSVT